MTKLTKRPHAAIDGPTSTRRSAVSGTASERLTSALVERACLCRGIKVARSASALDSAVDRASREMRAQGRAEDLRALLAAASSPMCVALLDGATKANDDDREIAIDAAKRFVGTCVEHHLESPSATALILDACAWAATAAALFVRSLARGLTTDDEQVRLRDRASTRASQSLSQGLALEREHRAAKPKAPTFAWLAPPALPSPAVEADASNEPIETEPDDRAYVEEVEERAPHPNPGLAYGAPAPTYVDEPAEPGGKPSGVALAGRHELAPAFVIPGFDSVTLRMRPTKAPGPTAETIREQAGKGRRWDGRTWVKGKERSTDE